MIVRVCEKNIRSLHPHPLVLPTAIGEKAQYCFLPVIDENATGNVDAANFENVYKFSFINSLGIVLVNDVKQVLDRCSRWWIARGGAGVFGQVQVNEKNASV
jgi:hypothetical protein